MLNFSNVSKSYPNGHQALSCVDFELGNGEMAFLTGHSGAGKTTVLKLIMRLEPLTSGQIVVNGKNLSRLRHREIPILRRSIGIILQNPYLLAARTIFDNVALPLVILGYRHQEIAPRVRAALAKVKLADKEKLYPCDLSAGEQQRVGIARAVVARPSLLLADEPTGNLDPLLAAEIMRLFEEFNRVGVSVLIATHDLPLIARMPYRILTLKQGKLLNQQR